MILPYIYVYRLTFTGQSWFIAVGVYIKGLDGEIHAINEPFLFSKRSGIFEERKGYF